MGRSRRSVIKIGQDLAIDFANTAGPASRPAGALGSWRELVDFVELRAAVSRSEGAALRAMGERDARACAAALDQARLLRDAVRAVLGAMADRRALKAEWIAAINQALVWGAGSTRLERRAGGWQLGFIPSWTEPFRALAPIARATADLVAQGRSAEIKRCANPRCVLYFRDRSRARRRRWCSMAVCGNRMKVAAHARRHGRRRFV
ncbi:MAG TPA: CGNR zinc finger domain-containing protein [Methylomirabilota bacterium]